MNQDKNLGMMHELIITWAPCCCALSMVFNLFLYIKIMFPYGFQYLVITSGYPRPLVKNFDIKKMKKKQHWNWTRKMELFGPY
jgi:hypothetical protein